MKLSLTLWLASITGLLAFTPQVFGAQLILDCTAAPVSTLTSGAPNGTSSITCPQFDPSVGTLNGYILFTRVGPNPPVTGTLTVMNNGATTATDSANILEDWQLTTFAGISTTKIGVNPSTAVLNLAAGATGSFALQFNLDSPVLPSTVQTALLASLIGTGTVHAADFAVTSRDPGQSGSLVLLDYAISAPVNASVVYLYDAAVTPEPSTLTLAAGGVAFLLLAKRLR